MREQVGNLWNYQIILDAICIPTNGCWKSDGSAVMGTGLAFQTKQRFKGIEYSLGKILRVQQALFRRSQHMDAEPWNVPYLIETVPVDYNRILKIYSFPTKPTMFIYNGTNAIERTSEHLTIGMKYAGWKSKSRTDIIQRSAEVLEKLLADDPTVKTIGIPRVGCGSGELSWQTTVEPILAPILGDKFLVFY